MKRSPSLLTVGVLAVLGSNLAHAASTDDALTEDIGVVLTPTRLKQAVADVPGSVTVITANMLSKYGVRNVPEAMRLVPGMEVVQLTSGDYRISYHGTSLYSQRRLSVLIDGVAVFRAERWMDWADLPVAIDDIERIEVMRGSSTAAYGSNGLLAIVNIITKDPATTDGAAARVTAGSRGLREGYARFGGQLGASTNFRVSAQHSEGRGFDQVTGFGAQDKSLDHDASRRQVLSWKSTTRLTAEDQLDVRSSFLESHEDQARTDQYQSTFPDTHARQSDVSITWRHVLSEDQEFKVHAYALTRQFRQGWLECLPAFVFLPELGQLWESNPDYVRAVSIGRIPTGGTPQDNALLAGALLRMGLLGPQATMTTCGNANNDYHQRTHDVEFEHTFAVSRTLRMVSGLGLRRDASDSATYLGGRVGVTTWRAYTNLEYRPSDRLSMNAGGFYQKDSLSGTAFSPRASLNWHLDANNTLRLVVSRSARLPDMFEQRANWSYLVTDMTPPINSSGSARFAQSAHASGNLTPERMVSREIGYVGNFPQYGLTFDAKIFDDSLTKLLSQPLILDSFNPTNEGRVHLTGAELQADYESASGWSGHAGYTRLNNSDNGVIERTLYSRDSLVLAMSRNFDSGWRASVAVYESSASPQGQSRYGRQDVTLSKAYRLSSRMTLSPSFTVSHLSDRLTMTTFDPRDPVVVGYANATQYAATLRLTY
jgi:iron complex outermembrane receptor protein